MTLFPENSGRDRRIVNRWIFARDSISIIQLLGKQAGKELQGDGFIGYIYVDHNAGISMKLHALCNIDDNLAVTITQSGIRTIAGVTFRYNTLTLLDLQLLSDVKITALSLPYKPEWLQFYEDPDYVTIRNMTNLDRFRADGYFDDVQVMLFYEEAEKIPEMIWVRLGKYLPETNSFHGIILNQPFEQCNVNEGDMVEVKEGIFQGEMCLVLDWGDYGIIYNSEKSRMFPMKIGPGGSIRQVQSDKVLIMIPDDHF